MITDPVFYFAAVPAVIFFGIAKGGFGTGLGILSSERLQQILHTLDLRVDFQ